MSRATVWTTATPGAVDNLANWTDGSVSPGTFSTPGDTWVVNQAMTLSAATWTVGTPLPAAPVSVVLDPSGSIKNSVNLTVATIIVHGSVSMNGGKLLLEGGSSATAGPQFDITINGSLTISSGSSEITAGLGTQDNTCIDQLRVNGDLIFNAGTINAGYGTQSKNNANNISVVGNVTFGGGILYAAKGTQARDNNNTMTITGNVTMTAGTIAAGGGGQARTSDNIINVTGDFTMSGGTIGAGCNTQTNGCDNLITINGDFTMTGGTVAAANATQAQVCNNTLNVNGNYSTSGSSSMIQLPAGISGINTVNIGNPTPSAIDLIDNTSSGSWTETTINVLAGCKAQLNGNFATVSGTGLPMFVYGTLICPAAFAVNGNGNFTLASGARLVVAHATGINGALTTTGTLALNTAANYDFNGSVAQVTGSYLPTALIAPDTITVSNSAGVTLTQSTATTGTLLFTAGILHTTTSFTMSTPGAPGAVVGAGATSYVEGTLVKNIVSYTSVNYEVGDLSYVPMELILSSAGTGGSLGVRAINGLHPSVGTSGFSTSMIVNHYWRLTDYSSAGPATVVPKGTYNFADIIGGSNASFKTQQYRSSAWLAAPLASVNTSTPYTTAPTTGIALGTLAGDIIYGSDCSTPAISGSTSLCVGTTTTLSNAGAGGTWSSDNTAVATIDASGVVYGVAAGSATISYMLTCPATIVVNVGTLPITGGGGSICPSGTVALSDATPGGVWTSSNTSVATVSATGVVYGVSGGTVSIIYTFGSCTPVSTTITVGSGAPITGITSVCTGSTTNLSNSTAGGTWSSGSPGVATVAGGVVGGVSAGNAVITYTLPGGCYVTATVTVTSMTPITGGTTVCAGSTINLSNSSAGGTWSSGSVGIATVTPTGGVVSGVSGGTAVISYSVGSCFATRSVTVIALTPITGALNVCPGGTSQLSNATAGGSWTSGNPPVATISASGVVSGVSNGTSVITYTASGCFVTSTVTVAPLTAISGPANVCAGSTITLSIAATGGAWTSGSPSVATVDATTGVVGGVAVGTAVITYTSGSCYVTYNVTVSSMASISGVTTFCVAAPTTTLSDATPGGTWSSSNPAVATISPTGVVTAVSPGTTVVTYAGGVCSVTASVTVDPNTITVSGKDTVCAGPAHQVTLSTNSPGGVWTSSNTSRATVDAIGVVTGVGSAQTFTITYVVTNTCGTFTVMHKMYVRSATKCATGIEENEGATTGLSVFPNPSDGTFNVNVSSADDEEVRIVITNVVGEVVKEQKLMTNQRSTVHIDMPPGVYLLSAFTDHGRYVARIVVRQ